MSDTVLSDEQWEIIAPFLPRQPALGRRRKQDRAVLNSLVYRLKTGCRYRDIPRTEAYAAPSTTHYWVNRWVKEGMFDQLWQHLLALLDAEGKLDLSEGSLDGSFVASKRGAKQSSGAIRARALQS